MLNVQPYLYSFPLFLSVCVCPGPVSSVLVNRYGSRPVVITGGLMCSVSMVAASFSSTITHLYICIGIVGGTETTLLPPSPFAETTTLIFTYSYKMH